MQEHISPLPPPPPSDLPFTCPPSQSLSSLLGIRLHWNPPRLSSSLWLRKACPACHPAWGRFTPSTGTPTASSTSPMPHKRCSEHPNQRPGRPAEPQTEKHELNPGQMVVTPHNQTGKAVTNRVMSSFCLRLHIIQTHDPLLSFKHSNSIPPSCSASSAMRRRLTLMMSLFQTD